MDVRMDVRNEPKRLRWPMHGLLAQRCQFCDTSLTSREAQPFTLKNTGSFLSIQADFRSFWRHIDVNIDVNMLPLRARAVATQPARPYARCCDVRSQARAQSLHNFCRRRAALLPGRRARSFAAHLAPRRAHAQAHAPRARAPGAHAATLL